MLKMHWRTAALALLFFVAFGLRLWTEQTSFPRPAVSFSALVGAVQIAAERSGLNLLAFSDWGEFGLTLDRATNFGRDGFHYGRRLRALGVEAAILPYSFVDVDVIIPAYAGLIVPWWLLMAAPLLMLARSWGIGNDLRIPSSGRTRIVAGGVLTTFVVLNLIPDAGRSGAQIEPDGVLEHLQLIFVPGTMANEVHLQYGWPSRCYACALVNGRLVDEFYGHTLGWKQDLLGENLALLSLAMAVVMLAGRRLTNGRTTAARVDGSS